MMGLWGEMRAYPFAAIPEEKFNNAFIRMKSDEERKKRKLSNGMSGALLALNQPLVPLAPKNFAGRILCLGFHPLIQIPFGPGQQVADYGKQLMEVRVLQTASIGPMCRQAFRF
jgi:hypothetical protein